MPRQNITYSAVPARQYRADKCPTSGFETLKAAQAEDQTRAKMLRKYADSPNSPHKRRAQQLAEVLSKDPAPPSLASAVYMRDLRIRVSGHLWSICEQESEAPSVDCH